MKKATKVSIGLIAAFIVILLTILFVSKFSNKEASHVNEEETPKIVYETYDKYEEDDSKFALTSAAVMTYVTDKITSEAKSKTQQFVKGQIKKVVTKAENWFKDKLLYCLEIEKTQDPPTYTSAEIYDQITEVKNQIAEMQNTLSILSEKTDNNAYYTYYTYFKNYLDTVNNTSRQGYLKLLALNELKPGDIDNAQDTNSEEFKTAYNAKAKAIDVNVRGKDNSFVALEEQTKLDLATLSLGDAILGAAGCPACSKLPEFNAFEFIRHFAQEQTPWNHQRKQIEDTYLAGIIYTYRAGHSLVIFDLTYQMQLFGVEDVYLSSDQTIIAFKFNHGSESKVYYNPDTYTEEELKAKYAEELSNVSEKIESSSKLDQDKFSTLEFLFGFYEDHMKQYNQILDKFNSFTRQLNDNTFTLETQSNRQYTKNLTGMCLQDFVSLGGNDEFSINFDKFKNCTKQEFLEFIDKIKPSAGEMTLYQYLLSVGFQVPRMFNGSWDDVLVLGIERVSDTSRKDNTQYVRRFHLYCVDLDRKVKDIGNDSFKQYLGYTCIRWSGSCNNDKNWTHHLTFELSHNPGGQTAYVGIGSKYTCDLTKRTAMGGSFKYPYFVSLNGLSLHSASGTVERGNMSTGW